VTGEKGTVRTLLDQKERKRETDRTFGERGAKLGGGRVGKCATVRTHQGGGETVERNRTRFGPAVTFYQRRDALQTKLKKRTRKLKKKKKRRKGERERERERESLLEQ